MLVAATANNNHPATKLGERRRGLLDMAGGLQTRPSQNGNSSYPQLENSRPLGTNVSMTCPQPEISKTWGLRLKANWRSEMRALHTFVSVRQNAGVTRAPICSPANAGVKANPMPCD